MTAPVSSDLAWLDDLERAHAAASETPWSLEHDSCDCNDGMCSHGSWPYSIHGPVNVGYADKPADHPLRGYITGIDELSEADAALIVAAVNAVPPLIAELRKRDAALLDLRQQLRDLTADRDSLSDDLRAALSPESVQS